MPFKESILRQSTRLIIWPASLCQRDWKFCQSQPFCGIWPQKVAWGKSVTTANTHFVRDPSWLPCGMYGSTLQSRDETGLLVAYAVQMIDRFESVRPPQSMTGPEFRCTSLGGWCFFGTMSETRMRSTWTITIIDVIIYSPCKFMVVISSEMTKQVRTANGTTPAQKERNICQWEPFRYRFSRRRRCY